MKQEKQDNKWLDEIRTEMQDFEADIPANGWERVSSALPVATPRQSSFSKRWIGVAASALLCVVMGGGYYFFEEISETIPQTSIAECQPSQATLPTASIPSPEIQTVAPSKQIAPKPLLAAAQQRKSPKQAEETQQTIAETTPSAETEVSIYNNEEQSTPALTDIPSLKQEEEAVLLAMNEASSNVSEVASWSVGLLLGAHGAMLDTDMTAVSSSMSDVGTGIYEGSTTPTHPDEVIDSNHHSSWSIGLSVGKAILPRTTLETGIIYTLLTSEVKLKYSGINSQSIQYLGIPIKLNYEIFQGEKTQFYVGGGIMLERALSAIRGGKKLDVAPWQWSSNLSVGGQYRVSRNVSIYLEPGVNWYFDADSSVPSLYSESPVYFNLRGGIRLTY